MKKIFVLLVFISTVGLTRGSEKRPMGIDDVLALRQAGDPQISPDGESIVFVVTHADLENNVRNSDLWLVTTGGEAPRQLTQWEKRDDQPSWSPDGQMIAFISDRDGKPQIYLISVTGGEASRLTSHPVGIDRFEWSPVGRRMAFIAKDPIPEQREKEKREGFDQILYSQEHQYARISIIDVPTQKVTLLTSGSGHAVDLAWSPAGRSLAFTSRSTPKLADAFTTEIFLLDLEGDSEHGGTPRQLTRNDREETNLAWSPDGRALSYLSTTGTYRSIGPDRIHVLDPANPEKLRILHPSFDGYIRNQVWDAEGQSIYVQADLGVHRRIYRIDADGTRLEALTPAKGSSSGLSVAAQTGILAFLRETPEEPADVWIEDGKTPGKGRRLTQLNPQLNDLLLAKTEIVRWKSSKDQREIEGLLVYPLSFESSRRYPLVTSVHGGPEGAYVESFMATHSEFPHVLAGEGYACFFPNFRGSSNYGQSFAEANVGDLGGGDFQDVISGIDYLVERDIADPNRLAIKGWSYGAYMSGWAIGHTERFKAAVFGAGLSNAVSYYSQADIQYQRETLHEGTPWRNPENMLERSPVFHLQHAKTPSLIFHGEKDERVPLPQSLETYMGLHKHGVPVELVIYPREGHGLREPKHQLDKIRRELNWLKKYIELY